MLQDSLTALLSTIPEINVISLSNDLDSAVTFISDNQPLVCIIDFSDQGAEQIAYVNGMKLISPELKNIALVEDIKVRKMAESLEFDEVIVKGGKAENLLKAVMGCMKEIH